MIFERATSSSIFINREVLRPDYIPDELPHREEQIARLGSILAPALQGARPSNVFIYGLTGTGKTAVTKFVLKKLKQKALQLGVNVISCYVNVRQDDTTYRVILRLSECLGLRLPFTGLSTAEAYRRFIEALDAKSAIFISVLDEIDFLVRKQGDELLYRLTRGNEELAHSKITVVGITNDIKLVENLDPRVRSSLGEVEIVFPPYNAVQLEDILRQRAKLAFRPGVLGEGVIQLCAALAAREHGDARRALDLLRVAGEIAEREGSSKVLLEHVYKARMEIERDRVSEVVQTLPLHGKLILYSILSITRGQGSATTGEVYNYYRALCRRLGIESVTQRRASDIISELDMLGVINARIVSRGRYGKTRIISLAAPYEAIEAALLEDPRIRLLALPRH
ncbi:MAG: cell division control protein Cdc6 [Thermoprotei archaeon]|nr:MAG: cell division control protein Cdc6 [Thermoprotei archaeon]